MFDSESNISVLNKGNEPILVRLRFVLKLGYVPPVSTIGMGMGSRFYFSFFKNGSSRKLTLVHLLQL